MTLEIEKYLAGEMSEEDRKDFERRLLDDPELAVHTEQAKILLQHLKDQMLREKINLIVNKPSYMGSTALIKKWMWLAAALAILIISLVFWLRRPAAINYSGTEATPVPEIGPQNQENKDTLPQIQRRDDALPAKNPDVKEKQKLAYQPITREPTLRGNATNDPEWNKLVESAWQIYFNELPANYGNSFASIVEFLRDKKFIDAYIRLQMKSDEFATNDTLHFLKGYCLLELKEGEEALLDFARVDDGTGWQQQIEWYQVLAYLINGDLDQAKEAAKAIMKSEDHDFNNEALNVVKLLQ